MISPIYAKRNKGQVVTAACQWMWEHKRLAFKLMLLPLIIGEALLFVNMIMFDSWVIYVFLLILYALFVPVLSNFMFYVVENPDEFGYPGHTYGLLRVYKNWWHYFWPIVKIMFLTGLLDFVLSFTVIVPLLMPLIQQLSIVICQREEDKDFGALPVAIKMCINSLGTFLMCLLSSSIICVCLVGVPCLMVTLINEALKTYMSHALYRMITSVFGQSDFNIYILVISFGVAISWQIINVISHFFYGHCKETNDHPALIDRMEQFS